MLLIISGCLIGGGIKGLLDNFAIPMINKEHLL